MFGAPFLMFLYVAWSADDGGEGRGGTSRSAVGGWWFIASVAVHVADRSGLVFLPAALLPELLEGRARVAATVPEGDVRGLGRAGSGGCFSLLCVLNEPVAGTRWFLAVDRGVCDVSCALAQRAGDDSGGRVASDDPEKSEEPRYNAALVGLPRLPPIRLIALLSERAGAADCAGGVTRLRWLAVVVQLCRDVGALVVLKLQTADRAILGWRC